MMNMEIKRTVSFLMVLICVITATAQDQNRQMKELIEERKEKTSEYLERIEKKTGLFGNQSKKDLKEANELLRNVVEIDNRIFGEAERIILHSNYETTSAGKDLGICLQQKEKLLQVIENMKKQNGEDDRSGTGLNWFLLTVTTAGFLLFAFLYFRERKRMAG